jgi:tetratricopeptide (TPR) repeat protein
MIDLQRTLRALHWQTNARTHQAKPHIDQNTLRHARELQLTGDYTGSMACVQADPNWEHDPNAWRLIGLCSQALARYEEDLERQKQLYQLCEKAARNDRRRRLTAAAEADVNLAGALIDQKRYDEALEVATRARDTDPRLPTAHVAILAIHKRLHQSESVIQYLRQLAHDDARIFEDPIFCDHVAADPDLDGISTQIASVMRSAPQ